MYILLKKGEYWLIDSKKKCFLLDDKWKPIFLQMIYSQNLNFKKGDNTRQNMSTGILDKAKELNEKYHQKNERDKN